jgi:hypothetical protein
VPLWLTGFRAFQARLQQRRPQLIAFLRRA